MQYRKLTPEEILKTKKLAKEVRKLPRTPIYGVLDNIRSLYNVGAMFRTADGIMAEKLYLCGMTGMPPRREIDKTSLGACDTVPWEYKKTSLEAIKELKEKGVQIVALELTEPSVHFTELSCDFPAALVVGHEIDGVSDEAMKYIDTAISIPMLGRANSLNVATAFGIAVYQMLDVYMKKQPRK
ncbi:RNA methyltransferase [Patescibacteria group bacterium]